MIENYSVQDVLGILRVLPFFSLVLFVPGYLIGIATNVLNFRSSKVVERVPLALILSSAASPYLINTLCRLLSVRAVANLFVVFGFLFVGTVAWEWHRGGFRCPRTVHWTTKTILILLVAWAVLCLVSLSDIQVGNRVYPTVATYDHVVRSAFISSALRTGAPPATPFFYAGFLVPARYYYYWNVLCAIPASASGENSRLTLYASCFWSGLLFASTIPIYLKHFLNRCCRLRITSLIGIGLITITGLDLIPVVILKLGGANAAPLPDIEWWDPVQVTSWLDALFWVPHHVAALVACLAAFLFLWKALDASANKGRMPLLLLSSLGFSSAAGLSIYVTFAFTLFMAVWTVYLALRRRGQAVLINIITGCVSVGLSLFYLRDLLEFKTGDIGSAGHSSFFAVNLRELPFAISDLPVILGGHSHLAVLSISFLLCIVVLFLELGAYFIIAIYQANYDWKHRKKLSEAQKALWMMFATALAVMLFLRSTVLQSNDLGWRAGLMLQFVLLLWTAIYVTDEASERWSGSLASARTSNNTSFNMALICMIFLGGTASLYQLWNLRTFTLLSEKHEWHIPWRSVGLTATGAETFQIREAYQHLDRLTSPDAIVQFNPDGDLRLHALGYSRYPQVDAGSPDCAISFGGSLSDCLKVQVPIKRIYDPGSADALSETDVEGLCHTLGISVLVVTSHDPVWKTSGSWIWQSTPIVKNDLVRMYRCSSTP